MLKLLFFLSLSLPSFAANISLQLPKKNFTKDEAFSFEFELKDGLGYKSYSLAILPKNEEL